MKHTAEDGWNQCGCRSSGERTHNNFLETSALIDCVDDFASHMKKKLLDKYHEGWSGWDDTAWIEGGLAKEKLIAHLEKGDMVDVANFTMFIWNAEDSQ